MCLELPRCTQGLRTASLRGALLASYSRGAKAGSEPLLALSIKVIGFRNLARSVREAANAPLHMSEPGYRRWILSGALDLPAFVFSSRPCIQPMSILLCTA